MSKLLTELDKNGVIKRARIGRKYAIEPSIPLMMTNRSAVEKGANRSKALSRCQEALFNLIVTKARKLKSITLKEIFEESPTGLDIFIDDLSRLEMLNYIITHRSHKACQCFTIPNHHKSMGVWPTTPFKAFRYSNKYCSIKPIIVLRNASHEIWFSPTCRQVR